YGHVASARRRFEDGGDLSAPGDWLACGRQPRAPEPRPRGRAAGPLRRGRADRQPGIVAGGSAGKRGLSALDAVAAEFVEPAARRGTQDQLTRRVRLQCTKCIEAMRDRVWRT